MLYNTHNRLKKGVLTAVLLSILLLSCSCTLLTKPLDNRTGFTSALAQVETSIKNDDWQQAKASLETSKKAWKKMKPLLQVDIDHDYIKDIEDGFVKLDGYVATKDKPNSLVAVLLVKHTWGNIGLF